MPLTRSELDAAVQITDKAQRSIRLQDLRMQASIYSTDSARYTRFQTAKQSAGRYLIETVGEHGRQVMRLKDSLLDKILGLKAEFAPSDDFKKESLLSELTKLKEGLKVKDHEQWCTNWQRLRLRFEQYEMVHELAQMPREFAKAVRESDEAFGTALLRDIQKDPSIQLDTLVRDYRDYMRTTAKARTSKARVHATTVEEGSAAVNATFTGQQSTTKRDASPAPQSCAEITGKPASEACAARGNCPIINLAKRPAPDKRDDKFKKYYTNYLKFCRDKPRFAAFQATRRNCPDAKKIHEEHEAKKAAKATASASASASDQHNFSGATMVVMATQAKFNTADRWILDSCSETHVINDPTKAQFTPTAMPNGMLIVSANTYFSVVCIGTAVLSIGGITLTLNDVAYCPGFHINIVSEPRLRTKGAWVHGKTDTLYWTRTDGTDQRVCQLVRPTGTLPYLDVTTPAATTTKQVVEWPTANGLPVSVEAAIQSVNYTATTTTSATAHETTTPHPQSFAAQSSRLLLRPREGTGGYWHAAIGHPRKEVIQHLQANVEGIVVADNKVPQTHECGSCSLAKGTHIISRRPRHTAKINTPFGIMAMDIIQFEEAYNKDLYLLHAYDTNNRYHFVDTSTTRSQPALLSFFKEVVAIA